MIFDTLFERGINAFMQETYKKAASQVLYGRKKADALILGINASILIVK